VAVLEVALSNFSVSTANYNEWWKFEAFPAVV